MLPYFIDQKPAPKCHLHHGELPAFVSLEQPPQKKKPFSLLWATRHFHTMELLLPAQLLDEIQRQLTKLNVGSYKYSKVMMKPLELLQGDFFTDYIKRGNIVMLSEGRRGVDDLFALYEGVFHMELSRSTYERAGIVGKPIYDGGRKHTKARYAIDINLRAPSMVHGKNGFERLVWACKNVLNESKVWLFHDVRSAFKETQNSSGEPNAAPIDHLHPLHKTTGPSITHIQNVHGPNLPRRKAAGALRSSQRFQQDPKPHASAGNATNTSRPSTPVFPLSDLICADQDYAAELLEYFSLLSLRSPRLDIDDTLDRFLCRYDAPSYSPVALTSSQPLDVVSVRWDGYLTANIGLRILLAAKKALATARGTTIVGSQLTGEVSPDSMEVVGNGDGENKTWVAMNTHGFFDEHSTILMLKGCSEDSVDFMQWEHQSPL